MLITQSIVKALEEYCPRKVYDQYGDGNETTSVPKQRGSYFETLALGSGANGVVTSSLPLLKSGEKSVDHVRIEQQATRFKNMFNPSHADFCGRNILTKQEVVEFQGRRGTIDFTTQGVIWDLKLTADLDGYWATPENNDLLQQVFYRWLYKQKYGTDMETRLLIFEYGPRTRIKEIKINVSEHATSSALQRFDKITESVAEWELLDEWPRIPSEKSCSICSLACSKRVLKDNIIFQEITL
jgi:hypothetical protein